MKLSKKKQESFLNAQLMTLIAVDLVETHANLNPAAREACENAKAVAVAAIDKLVADYPRLAKSLDKMTKNLAMPSEQTNGAG